MQNLPASWALHKIEIAFDAVAFNDCKARSWTGANGADLAHQAHAHEQSSVTMRFELRSAISRDTRSVCKKARER